MPEDATIVRPLPDTPEADGTHAFLIWNTDIEAWGERGWFLLSLAREALCGRTEPAE